MKWCSSCKSFVLRENFQKNRAKHDGLQNYCKPCRNLLDRDRAQQKANGYANQLEAGIQIRAYAHHHIGMAVLKARRGDPRPLGMTLSLINFESPQAYWGWDKKPYRLSTNPDDYAWESNADNNKRKQENYASAL